MGKTDFDRLMDRYLTGRVSEEEKLKIEAWLDVVKTDESESFELSREDEDRIFRDITESIAQAERLVAPLKAGIRRRRTAKWTWQIAASVALALAVLSFFGWQYLKESSVREELTEDRVNKIMLADGTLVWLWGDSRLNYYERSGDGTRIAELAGDALFEVAKDPYHPFVLQCGGASMTVLGTSFRVSNDSSNVSLSVLTGKVNFKPAADQEGIEVSANEKIVYKGGKDVKQLVIDKKEREALIAHTSYDLKFDRAPMSDIVTRLEEKFNIHIQVRNPRITRCIVNADFTDQSLNTTLQMITEMLDIQFVRQDNIVTLTGKGCD